jgi:transcriptional regulator with XRE-family HTH domain
MTTIVFVVFYERFPLLQPISMSSLEKRFGETLKRLRVEKGLSQEALAEECDLDRTYISLLERGLRQPTLITLFKISEVLKVSPSSIVKELEK